MGPDDERIFDESATMRDYIKHMRDTWQLLAWIWREFINEKSRGWIKRFYAMSVLSRVMSLAFPFLMGMFIEGIVERNEFLVGISIGGTLLAYVVTTSIEWTMGRSIELTLGENTRSLERKINELFFSKNLGLHIQEGSTLTQANMEKGLNRFHSLQQTLFFGGMDSLNTIIITTALLSMVSPTSGLIICGALVLNIGVSLVLNKMIMSEMDPIDADMRAYNRRRNERWDHVERVITTDNGMRETEEMTSIYSDILRRDRRVWLRYISYTTLRHLINGTAVVLVMLYTSNLAMNGAMSVTMLIPTLTWASMASQQIRFLARAEREINWVAPSVRSMRDALLLAPTIEESAHAVEIDHTSPVRVQFVGIGHTYGTGDGTRTIMQDVTFEVAPGKKVALIGPSGAGKSTLTQLLQRYDDATSGHILVNGVDLRQITPSSWRRLVGYIAQRPQVFSGTIRDNLLYGLRDTERERITDSEIWDFLKALGIDFGARLTQGLDTRVGRNGMKLSGGEAQRLMIAAAAIKRPRFMIVDEATSSLDSESQASVQAGINQVLAGDSSALIIAHRLSTVLGCDGFVVLRPIDEVGPGESQVEAVAHSVEELWRISPTFRRLATLEGVRVNTTA